jgi:hypothetical protein
VGDLSNVHNVAMWNHTAQLWQDIDGGVRGIVLAVKILPATLEIFVGGAFEFHDAQGQLSHNIARWSSKEGWASLAGGLSDDDTPPHRNQQKNTNNYNNNYYYGYSPYLTRKDGTVVSRRINTDSSSDNNNHRATRGSEDLVYRPCVSALESDGQDVVFVGGNFTKRIINSYTGTTTEVKGLVGWNTRTSSWIVLQNSYGCCLTRALAYDETSESLYVGGSFSFTAGSDTFTNFARMSVVKNYGVNNSSNNSSNSSSSSSGSGYDLQTSWASVVPTCESGLPGECENQIIASICLSPQPPPSSNAANFTEPWPLLFIGGQIPSIDGIVMNGIAQLAPSSSSSVAARSSGVGRMGGSFQEISATGQSWKTVGGGMTGGTGGVSALGLSSSGRRLYAGGSFDRAGTLPVDDVAVWDLETAEWSGLPPITGWSGSVVAVAVAANYTTGHTASSAIGGGGSGDGDGGDSDPNHGGGGGRFFGAKPWQLGLLGLVGLVLLAVVSLLTALGVLYLTRRRRDRGLSYANIFDEVGSESGDDSSDKALVDGN